MLGVALEQDSRNVAADDFDQDGRMDLVVTTFEAWPEIKQTLKVYRNQLQSSAHWIGLRLREGAGGLSPVGAQVTVQFGGRTAVQDIVAGDSYRSQTANTVHFGLGAAALVDWVEVRWLNGRSLKIANPAVDQYHELVPPAE